jgi:5-methylthioadenosine/S-adenosylhomocysteine deaminase
MLISAPWVLPISSPPIHDGAVLVRDEMIAAVGTLERLSAKFADEPHEHFSECMITPGLVNAHTHLTLSALAGVVPPLPFAQWLPRLVAALRPWEIADHEASGIVGAEESLACGVTVVGDIAYGAAEVTSASAAGLGGVYYWELLGIPAEEVAATLEGLRFPRDPAAYGPRVVCGLSPHSPYTSGPTLLRAVDDLAQELGVPSAIHLSESLAELALLRDGSGPLAGTAARTAIGFTPPGTTPVEYVSALGALEGTTAVHLCHVTPHEIELLALHVRGAVTCPRSNRYLHNPPPSIAPLLAAGIPVGVGTDSSASNDDLDLMSELRVLRSAEKTLSAATLLHMATAGGARAIGVDDRYGTLEPGRFADLVVHHVASTDDPEEALVERGGRANTRAVMSGGRWRVRDGSLLHSDTAAARRAGAAHERSAQALAGF